MTDNDRRTLRCVSQLLDYPDHAFFERIPEYRALVEEVRGFANPILHLFLDELEALGPRAAQEAYVGAFDHDPASSLYLTWRRYGNDRKQGRAMASLNELYRDAGFEPVPGVLPDYAPRVLEFLSVCEDWAAITLLDGFGPELASLGHGLEKTGRMHAPLFSLAVDILSREYPPLFRARERKRDTAAFNSPDSRDGASPAGIMEDAALPEASRERVLAAIMNRAAV